jgi:hypothetical protein
MVAEKLTTLVGAIFRRGEGTSEHCEVYSVDMALIICDCRLHLGGWTIPTSTFSLSRFANWRGGQTSKRSRLSRRRQCTACSTGSCRTPIQASNHRFLPGSGFDKSLQWLGHYWSLFQFPCFPYFIEVPQPMRVRLLCICILQGHVQR